MTRKPVSMACPQLVLDWIAWYPDGELPPDVRSQIEVHAAECSACRQEIANFSDAAASGARDAAAADRVFARAVHKIEAYPRRAAPAPRRRLWLVRPRLAIAAGLAVAVISGTAGIVATQQLAYTSIYETATAAADASHLAIGPHLDVVFRGDASFAEVSSAIHALGANVASGPTPRGVVRLQLAQGADAAVAAQRLESGDLRVADFAQPAP